MNDANKILVTGASGFIGGELVRLLCSLGYSVTVLTRRVDHTFPKGVRPIRGDLLDPLSLPHDLFCGVKTVFNCAGEIKNISSMRSLHVNGTANLVNLALKESLEKSLPPIRWIQLSSVGAYGPIDRSLVSRVVTECTPENPCGDYEVTKTEADQFLRSLSQKGKITLTILRPSNVFGYGMPNRSLTSLLNVVRSGLFFYIGSRDAISNYIHVDDVTRALVACANSPIANGKIYNLSNDCPMSDLVDAVAVSGGRSKPSLVVPESLVRIINGVFEGRKFWPLTASRIDALVSKTRYPADLIQRELDFKISSPVPVSALELLE